MNRLKLYISPFIAGLIVVALSSCASTGTSRQGGNASLANPETATTSSTTQFDSVAVAATSAQAQQKTPATRQSLRATSQGAKSSGPAKTVTLNIYQVDSQCDTLVPAKAAVPSDSPVESAVANVLKQTDSADFELAGYRVQVNPTSGVATVDFRLSPNTRRQFVSLSMCEQFALFGSLRKTLTTNSQLKIKNVRFTEQGREIVL